MPCSAVGRYVVYLEQVIGVKYDVIDSIEGVHNFCNRWPPSPCHRLSTRSQDLLVVCSHTSQLKTRNTCIDPTFGVMTNSFGRRSAYPNLLLNVHLYSFYYSACCTMLLPLLFCVRLNDSCRRTSLLTIHCTYLLLTTHYYLPFQYSPPFRILQGPRGQTCRCSSNSLCF